MCLAHVVDIKVENEVTDIDVLLQAEYREVYAKCELAILKKHTRSKDLIVPYKKNDFSIDIWKVFGYQSLNRFLIHLSQ